MFEGADDAQKRDDNVVRFFTAVILLGGLITALLLGWLVNVKCGLMFAGFWALSQYINITLTSLGNVMLGRDISTIQDVGWKTIFLMTASICLAIAICIR